MSRTRPSRTRTRRHLRLGVALTAGATALAVAFAAGLAVGDDLPADPQTGDPAGPGPAKAPPGPEPGLVPAAAPLRPAGSCTDLRDTYVERGVAAVGPYGWGGRFEPLPAVLNDRAVAGSAADMERADPGTTEATSSRTGTNVQEAGVDEPDVAKTDGETVYRLADGTLHTYDVTGEQPRELASHQLDALTTENGGGRRDATPQMLLVGEELVVTGQRLLDRDDQPGTHPGTVVLRVDVTDPANPRVTETQRYDATLAAARRHGAGSADGGVVRLVLRASLPDLDFTEPGLFRDEEQAEQENAELVRETTIEDWLPTVRVTDDTGATTTRRAVACEAVTIPEQDRSLGTLAVVTLGEDEGLAHATGLATGSGITYFSPDRLYVATGSAGRCCRPFPRPVPEGPDSTVRPPAPGGPDGTTTLHGFALDERRTTYRASGEVPGSVADRWSMDAADGVLRVAVGPTSETGDFNSVVTLAEEDGELTEQGRVDELGVGEEIKAVRWFDRLAVVVTFRRVDPLYAVDLSEPASPEALGQLKMPGFSSYLHPLGEDRMLGVGQDADPRTGRTRGAQAALFGLSDLTDPRRLDTVHYAKRTRALAGSDPRQFTWLPDRRTALTVISRGDRGTTGWVSVLRVGDDRLRQRLVEVEHGSDVAAVRVLPLPDGRVALATGSGVEMLRPARDR